MTFLMKRNRESIVFVDYLKNISIKLTGLCNFGVRFQPIGKMKHITLPLCPLTYRFKQKNKTKNKNKKENKVSEDQI